ncbi:hypothetical protein GcC1_051025 [Golovinomyces cichoracearum]|uniref:Uncharacterized protein n=1 Tax=Golovinomyces cichoracearum TaxID=62708 RepID=A0A420IWH6_9PEZI|nr:hypothetical protein GcC1_051025 [Golovinomyces cichoracearum]
MNSSKGSCRIRNYDTKSGKNRVSTSKRPTKKAVSSDSESEYTNQSIPIPILSMSRICLLKMALLEESSLQTQNDSPVSPLMAFMELKILDRNSPKPKNMRLDSSVAPHMMMLLAATYHLGFSSITRPAISTYYPSCLKFYSMAYCMMSLVSENIYFQEMCPSFSPVSFYTYCGYLYYYQILRANDEVGQGQLTRSERRVLQYLRNISEPEAWPVSLIEFFRAFGYCKSSNTAYSDVFPSFPVF